LRQAGNDVRESSLNTFADSSGGFYEYLYGGVLGSNAGLVSGLDSFWGE